MHVCCCLPIAQVLRNWWCAMQSTLMMRPFRSSNSSSWWLPRGHCGLVVWADGYLLPGTPISYDEVVVRMYCFGIRYRQRGARLPAATMPLSQKSRAPLSRTTWGRPMYTRGRWEAVMQGTLARGPQPIQGLRVSSLGWLLIIVSSRRLLVLQLRESEEEGRLARNPKLHGY